ncbi:prolipoprotein diacylglyceryltransferase [Longilinea arvoryzae]|uniref:Prolipoprotein diacylglyceryltransferase n=1 Tax=Longilinea arvoryzae TaxID=360412 RepID=A0A0S7BB44_9CHLR|nr:prolipoprotein diacylglyceryl transferase family protein [Longilinea arvoryzae]GAP14975.1 prolipoprotein diacylglyceryltransferase [Longilinea arvoryzae]
MLPILQIGRLAIPTPGQILLLGLWFGLTLSEKLARLEQKIAPDRIDTLAIIALAAGVLGARFFYAARSPAVFLQHPLNLVSLNTAMLDVTGGLICAGLAALIYIQRIKMKFWETLDALTPFFCVMAIAIGLAHFASGEAFGSPARLPWSIHLWGAYRHPTQLYETVLALGVAFSVWPRQRKDRISGLRFLLFVALSEIARIIVESFRGDSSYLFGTLRSAQVFAWLVLAVSLAVIGSRLKLSPVEGPSGGTQ